MQSSFSCRRVFMCPAFAILAGACARGPAVQTAPQAESPLVAVEASSRDTAAVLAAKSLIIPVEGVDPSRIRDSYTAARGGRTHDAVDILAPRGTPVLAADSGTLLKLRRNDAGGLTIYQLDHTRKFVYYYAHMDRYSEGLAEGMRLRQGQVIGFVGTTGNAPEDSPHLHFQVMFYRGRGQYWGGEPVNPHPLLSRTGRRR